MGNSEDTYHENKYEEIVQGLKSGEINNIIFITGAGISTGAGIPDFRSPTGIFASVKNKYNLRRPEDLFQIDSFLENPKPFYDFCKSFKVEGCLPTKSHLFQGFLCKKGLVNRIYTQNVDGLEIKAGVPPSKIVFAHGNITEAGCPVCKKEYDIEELRKRIMNDEVMKCDKCGSYVKPKCVFYGESLPKLFFLQFLNLKWTSIGIIIGTSLQVYPFATLASTLQSSAWRLMINLEEPDYDGDRPFEFNNPNKKDLLLKGKCDEIVEKLVKDVGWEAEFNEYCESTLAKLNNNTNK